MSASGVSTKRRALVVGVLAATAFCLHTIRTMKRDMLDQTLILSPDVDEARLKAMVDLRKADRPYSS